MNLVFVTDVVNKLQYKSMNLVFFTDVVNKLQYQSMNLVFISHRPGCAGWFATENGRSQVRRQPLLEHTTGTRCWGRAGQHGRCTWTTDEERLS